MDKIQDNRKQNTAAVHYRAAYRKEKRTNRRLVLALIIITCILAFLLIKISASSAEAERLGSPAQKYYTSIVVDPGDSLWSIAETYRTEQYSSIYDYMQEIMDINHLHSENLPSGNSICIPYYK